MPLRDHDTQDENTDTSFTTALPRIDERVLSQALASSVHSIGYPKRVTRTNSTARHKT